MKLTHHKKEVVCSTKGKKHQPPTSQSAVVQGVIHLLFHVRNKKKKKISRAPGSTELDPGLPSPVVLLGNEPCECGSVLDQRR